MLKLLCTQKTMAGLGLVPAENTTDLPLHPLWGGWYVNVFTVSRQKVYVFMSETTLFSVVIVGLKKKDVSNLPQLLKNELLTVLQSSHFTDEQIAIAIDGFDQMVISKTESKSSLGSINDLVAGYKQRILSVGGLADSNLLYLNQSVNLIPQRLLQWSCSFEAAKKQVCLLQS